MAPKRSILRKGLVLLAIPLLFQVLLVALVFWVRGENRAATEQYERTMQIIRHVDAPLVTLIEAQSSMRAYILTREPFFAEKMDARLETARRDLDQLRTLPEIEEQRTYYEQIDIEIQEFVRWLVKMRGLGDAGAWEEARSEIRDGVGARMITGISEDFRDFLAREDQLVAAQRQHVEETWNRLDQMLVLGLGILFSSTAFLAYVFGRGMATRIASIAENLRRLGEGLAMGPEVGGDDELSQLDRTLRAMARRLEEAAEKERTYRGLLERRATELDALNRELEQKNRENELFVYSVSHDLRSPLVNLQGFSRELQAVSGDLHRLIDRDGIPEDVRRQARALVEQDMHESLHFIQQAVSRLSAIIDALLRLSRAGRVEYRRCEVDVSSVVARIADALRGSLAEKGTHVEIAPLPPAWADPTAVEQIFANLLTNAVHYLDPERPGRIEVGSLGREGPDQVYVVRDNGLGVPEAYQEKIFAAFQRIHAEAAPGEGIGLTLVKRVVDRLGGQIWMESAPGQGSAFFVALPAEPDDQEATRAEDLDMPEPMAPPFVTHTESPVQETTA